MKTDMLGTYRHARSGFTLLELLLVMGITAVLLSLVTVSLIRPQTQATTDSVVLLLTSDLRQQQQKAMNGVRETSGSSSYGVYIQPHQYTLFQGSTYQAGNSTNLVIPLQTSTTLATTFAGSQIIFLPISGEVANFVSSNNSITITTGGGVVQTIQLNQYGVPQ